MALLVVALLLVMVCIVALTSLVRQVRALGMQIESLEGQVFRLTEQVQEQESRLEEMNREEAPAGIVPFVSSLSKSDGKSAFPTLALLGIRLLAAYLQRRRAKAPESTN